MRPAPSPPPPADVRASHASPGRRAAPTTRTLALLVVAVLVAHGLLLQELPRHFGPAADKVTSAAVAPLTTRRIELPPATAQPAEPPPRTDVTAKSPPQSQPKQKPRPKPESAPAPATPLSPPPAASPATPTTAATAESVFVAPKVEGPQPVITNVFEIPPRGTPSPPPPQPGSGDGAPDSGGRQAIAGSTLPSAPTGPALPDEPLPTPVEAMDLPASVDMRFKMTGASKGLNYYANSDIIWRNAGSSYELRAGVSVLFIGARSMTSTGQLGPEGLAPTRFSDKSRSEVAAHFEPDKGQITFSANTPPVRWLKGAQDRISVFMQLSGMLAGNAAAFPPGSTITVYTVGPRSADTWTFVVEGEETLPLPIGETQAIKLSRQPRRDYDQKVEIWFAPALVFLPVRNRITQANGDFIDQQLSSVERP